MRAADALSPFPVLGSILIVSRCQHIYIDVVRMQAFLWCRSVAKVKGVQDEFRYRCQVGITWLVPEDEL
jgi:hypothetical protein